MSPLVGPVTASRNRWAIMRITVLAALVFAFVPFAGCQRYYQTSTSVDHSRGRGLLKAEYAIPDDAEIGDYRIIEVWAETDRVSGTEQIIVRLKGPHHGTEPRVELVEPKNVRYVSIWSERNGPPYEVWAAPDPLPEVLKFHGGDKTIEIARHHE